MIVAFFPLIVKSLGFDNVLESPSVSRASISNFNCFEPTERIIPRPEVPPTRKLVALPTAVPSATLLPSGSVVPPCIVSVTP